MTRHRIFLADDHAILREGLKSILDTTEGFQVMGEAGDGFELLHLLDEGAAPDVLILDLSMPKMSGIETLRRIRRMNFVFKTLVLTMHKEPDLLCRAFSVGADGYMLKDGMAKELSQALHMLLEGKIFLSPCIEKELPDCCQVKAYAGKEPPLPPIMHCGKNFTGPLLQAY
jgi:DNA-binding NarL/FixJ family response regulator